MNTGMRALEQAAKSKPYYGYSVDAATRKNEQSDSNDATGQDTFKDSVHDWASLEIKGSADRND